MSQMGQFGTSGGGGGGSVNTLTGNTGIATAVANNINVVGDGTTITTSGAGNTLTISLIGGSGGASSFPTNSGTATQSGGTLNILGASSGARITTSGSGDTVSIDLVVPVIVSSGGTGQTSLITNGVLYGLATSPVGMTSAGTNGQVLLGATGAAPAFASLTSSSSTIAFTGGANSLSVDINAPVPVAYGGTGLTTITAHSLLVGEGTSNIHPLGVATNGQIPIGSTGADPVLATLTGGSGISITNGAGTITITNTGASFAWTVITAATQSITVNNGYIANRNAGVTFTLPATAAVGDEFKITSINAGGWTLAQNSGQNINIVNTSTTAGVGGSLASTESYDSVDIICTVANTMFNVISCTGNITVV